jgi:PIN domain nuclease of toxin-antitoxin system
MTFLLDTNVWLWWTYGSTERFSIELRRDIASLHADVFVSTASLWEIAIKGALRKLEFPANPGTYALRQLKRQRFKLLNVDAPHNDHCASKGRGLDDRHSRPRFCFI